MEFQNSGLTSVKDIIGNHIVTTDVSEYPMGLSSIRMSFRKINAG